MRFLDLIFEANSTEKYGHAEITISNTPIVYPSLTGKESKFIAKYHIPNTDTTHIAAGDTRDQARENVIKMATTDPRQQDLGRYKAFAGDLNVVFTREYMSSFDNVWFKIDVINGKPYLIKAGDQYVELFNDADLRKDGFTRGTNRVESVPGTPTAAFTFGIPRSSMQKAGLNPYTRYSLKLEKKDDDDNEFFLIEFDSIIKSTSEKLRRGHPIMSVVPITT